MSFEDKYNKYKKKYLELKRFLQLGGTLVVGNTIYSIGKLGVIDIDKGNRYHYTSSKRKGDVLKLKEGEEWIKEDLTMGARLKDTIISIELLGTITSIKGDEVKYLTPEIQNKPAKIKTTQTHKENKEWVVIPKVSSEPLVSTQPVESSTTESSLKLPIDNINR
jgi:hypothetical protein